MIISYATCVNILLCVFVSTMSNCIISNCSVLMKFWFATKMPYQNPPTALRPHSLMQFR